ncbi:MAG: cellulose binding domain-containing protein [Chloroflexota bacterium]
MTTTLDRNRNPLTIVQGNAPANACKVDYTVNQWGTGYTADVKITNLGSSPIQGWTLEWRYANGQQITSAWNATVSQSGADVTASNPTTHWNGNIPANGGSVSFGVQGTHSGTNASPVAFMLNGLACNGGTVTPTHTPTATPTRTPTATRTPTVTTCPAVAGYVRLGSNSGAGLPGVKIYRNVNDIVSHYATTDSNGYFIGNGCGVIGMTYWPELAGYTFEPASRTLGEVSIENDFVARPTSIQPDLVITSFYESMIGYEGGGCVNEYNGYEFRVTVMNAGAAPAGSFEVAVEGSIQIVDGLAAGESITLHYPLPLEPSVLPTPSNTPWPGQVVAMADWTNVVAESNETNNSRTSSMATMTPPPLCTRTPTPTTPVASSCQVVYTPNSWNNGFTANIKIVNNGASAVQGWTLAYSYANGQQVTSAWNATVTQSGANVTASNPSSHWNGNIPANGGSVSFGVQGTHSGTNTNPTSFALNGVVCTNP